MTDPYADGDLCRCAGCRGHTDERAAIARMLREQSRRCRSNQQGAILFRMARAIERGDHRKEPSNEA